MISMPEKGIYYVSADKLDTIDVPENPGIFSLADLYVPFTGEVKDEEFLRKTQAEDYSPSAADTYPFTTASDPSLLGTSTDVTAGTPQLTTLEVVTYMSVGDSDDTFLSANLPFSCPATQNIPVSCQATTLTSTPSPNLAHSGNIPNFDAVTSTVLSPVSEPDRSPTKPMVIPIPKDEKMAEAVLNTLETGSIMPLIKEELKYTIQSRRLAAGKPELQVEFNPPKRQKLMTKEERERAEKRREQNRKAAQKFRQKQRDTAETLTKKTQKLEGSNTTLRAEIKRLTREKNELRKLFHAHLAVCPQVNAGNVKVKVDSLRAGIASKYV
nr:hypothetical protein BaRGS_035136 [Batillaria attramentaria]